MKETFESYSNAHKLIIVICACSWGGGHQGAVVTEQNWLRDVNEPDFTLPVACSFLPAALGADRSLVWRTLLNGMWAHVVSVHVSVL